MQPNIVYEIRHEAALTQARLAELADLSPLYIVRAEQGLYASLPMSLLAALSNIDMHSRTVNEIDATYSEQRNAMIYFNYEQVNTHPGRDHFIEVALGYALDNFQPGVGKRTNHPLYLFRTKLMQLFDKPSSAIKFATAYGIHPAMLTSIESRQATLEGVTCERIKALGLSEIQLEMLVRACDACL